MAFDKIDLLPAILPDSSFESFQRENLARIAKSFSCSYEECRLASGLPSFEEMLDQILIERETVLALELGVPSLKVEFTQ